MAALKTKGARNSDRKNGKAWGKNHGVLKAKRTPSPEKVARREARPQSHGGPSITMPAITWDWMEQTMVSRWPNTRKVRVVEAFFAMKRPSVKAAEDAPAVIETNPEIEASSARPSRKSLARASAESRKNGR